MYTKEDFKNKLEEYRKMVKDDEKMNTYDYAYYRALVDFENLLLPKVNRSN